MALPAASVGVWSPASFAFGDVDRRECEEDEAEYQALRLLGRGAFGEVLLVEELPAARHRRQRWIGSLASRFGSPTGSSSKSKAPSRLLAMKVISGAASLDDEQRAALELEVQLLSDVQHPCVLECEDAFLTKEGHLCILTEFCEFGDVFAFVRGRCPAVEGGGGPVEAPQALEWLVQLALGIHALHERSILHRDLKTQNLLLASSPGASSARRPLALRLADFGVARVLAGGGGGCMEELATTRVGTPCYMSPEVFAGRPYGRESDLWSLGCVLYEMVHGCFAFEAPTLSALALRVAHGRRAPFASAPAPSAYSSASASAKEWGALRRLVRGLLSTKARRRPTLQEVLHTPQVRRRIPAAIASAAAAASGRSAASAGWSLAGQVASLGLSGEVAGAEERERRSQGQRLLRSTLEQARRRRLSEEEALRSLQHRAARLSEQLLAAAAKARLRPPSAPAPSASSRAASGAAPLSTGPRSRPLSASPGASASAVGASPSSSRLQARPLSASPGASASAVGASPSSSRLQARPLSASPGASAAAVGALPVSSRPRARPLSMAPGEAPAPSSGAGAGGAPPPGPRAASACARRRPRPPAPSWPPPPPAAAAAARPLVPPAGPPSPPALLAVVGRRAGGQRRAATDCGGGQRGGGGGGAGVEGAASLSAEAPPGGRLLRRSASASAAGRRRQQQPVQGRQGRPALLPPLQPPKPAPLAVPAPAASVAGATPAAPAARAAARASVAAAEAAAAAAAAAPAATAAAATPAIAAAAVPPKLQSSKSLPALRHSEALVLAQGSPVAGKVGHAGLVRCTEEGHGGCPLRKSSEAADFDGLRSDDPADESGSAHAYRASGSSSGGARTSTTAAAAASTRSFRSSTSAAMAPMESSSAESASAVHEGQRSSMSDGEEAAAGSATDCDSEDHVCLDAGAVGVSSSGSKHPESLRLQSQALLRRIDERRAAVEKLDRSIADLEAALMTPSEGSEEEDEEESEESEESEEDEEEAEEEEEGEEEEEDEEAESEDEAASEEGPSTSLSPRSSSSTQRPTTSSDGPPLPLSPPSSCPSSAAGRRSPLGRFSGRLCWGPPGADPGGAALEDLLGEASVRTQFPDGDLTLMPDEGSFPAAEIEFPPSVKARLEHLRSRCAFALGEEVVDQARRCILAVRSDLVAGEVASGWRRSTSGLVRERLLQLLGNDGAGLAAELEELVALELAWGAGAHAS